MTAASGSLPFDELRAEVERLALEAGGIGTWEWDLATGRMRWSAQMFRNLGLAPRRGADLYRLLLRQAHPDDRDEVRSLFDGFRRRPGPLRLETRFLLPGGDVRWLVFLGKVLADAAGRPSRMLGITIDSTPRRGREEAAREDLRRLNDRLEELAEERARQLDQKRAQLQAFFENSPDWLTLFRATADGRFLYEDLNRATERAYGMSRDQVIGHTVEEILGREPAELPLRHMRACVETGENQRYTARRTMAGITRTVDVMFVRVPEDQGGEYFIIATARDITERERIEDQLRQSQKMEVVGQLTGGLAHDFNNLLTPIIGNLELLAPRVAGDAVAATYLRGAQRAAENGAKLTEQLLAFARRQHLQPRNLDLNAAIGQMRDLLARTIGMTIRVRTDLSADAWPALVDPTQLEIAIFNLAINARDAMPLGGTLTIETRNLRSGRDAIPLELGGRDCIRVSLRDTGIGMSEEVLRQAIEPFFTTKEVGKGSGLGLSQVYGMARQSGGALQIESRPGRGTAVHLFLPRAEAAAPSAADERRRSATPAGSGRHILVVDDDPAVREVAAQMLTQGGYRVADADGGQAALDALARGEAYDLLLVDIAMPGLDGIETVRRAREGSPDLRVLYVTGYADIAGIDERIGSDPLIRKPFHVAELTSEVRRALEHRRPDRRGNVVPLKKRRR